MIKPVYTTTYINKNINNICFFAEYIGCLYAILFIYCAAESNFSFFFNANNSGFRTTVQ